MPYLPMLDVIRSFIGVKEGDPERVIQEKLRQRILGPGRKSAAYSSALSGTAVSLRGR